MHDYWNDPSLNENEKFLRDYVLNKRYLDNDEDDSDNGCDETNGDTKLIVEKVDPVKVDLSEDEEIIENQETFEKKYNFRFEEPDPEFIKSYPRTINDTLRRKENKRKLKREEYKKRKEAEKQKKKEEIKRLKNLKKQEIEEKIDKIKKITGNEDLNLDIGDLDKDFDAAEHDKRMQELFDTEYYQNNVDETKPEFSDSDPDVGSMSMEALFYLINLIHFVKLVDDDYEDWIADEEEEEEEEETNAKKKKKKKKKNDEDDYIEPDFNVNI